MCTNPKCIAFNKETSVGLVHHGNRVYSHGAFFCGHCSRENPWEMKIVRRPE